MYNFIQSCAMLIYIILLTFYGRHFGFSKKKSFLLGLSAVVIDYFVIMLLTWIENGFTNWGAQNAVRVFVVNPLLIYLLSKVVRVNFRSLLDYHAVPAMFWYGLGHLACLSTGCCHGFTYYDGTVMSQLAHALTGTSLLPNQIIESIGALLIGLSLWIVAKKNHFQTKGYLYYIMLILYGSQRFLLEFLRDNDKLIVFSKLKNADGVFGISNLALWAAAMFIEGSILLYLTVRSDGRKTNF